jgi:hypothetical protein
MATSATGAIAVQPTYVPNEIGCHVICKGARCAGGTPRATLDARV